MAGATRTFSALREGETESSLLDKEACETLPEAAGTQLPAVSLCAEGPQTGQARNPDGGGPRPRRTHGAAFSQNLRLFLTPSTLPDLSALPSGALAEGEELRAEGTAPAPSSARS